MGNKDGPSADEHWCKMEFAGVDFGDKRLDARFKKTAEKLSEQPLSSINQALGCWADAKGAYRMFDNHKVTAIEILSPHQQKTLERIGSRKQVLVIQDTSHIDYVNHVKTEGLGPIGHTHREGKARYKSKGLIMHTALAVSTDGLPLGIIDQEIWARENGEHEPGRRRKRNTRLKRVPIEHKESYKWLRTIMRTTALIPAGVQTITVCDRESDIYEFMSKAEALKTHYLIRSSWDRAIQVEHEDYYLWNYMNSLPSMGSFKIEVEVKPNAKRRTPESRIAKLEVRFATVEIRNNPKKKMNRTECHPFLPTYAILVKEIHPPKGIEPLEWMLYTNVAVESFADAVERVNWYKLRWHIENFHKVLKSGCNIELSRLQTGERLKRYITLLSVVAWRLYWMTHINRVSPNENCSVVLADHEWKALYCKIKKTKSPPTDPPTVREAIRWVAQLGGFLGRKGDGEPGITTTWRGWQRLLDVSEAWLVFNS